MDRPTLETIRRFNRTVSQRIGALDDSYLQRGRPLGEARIVFEIGTGGSVDVSVLRQRLGLDSGYASRLLRALERQGLIETDARLDDRRSRVVRLTEKGREEWRAYDRLSDDLATSVLSGLDGGQRERLVAAMAEVEKLMRVSGITIDRERPDTADAQFCLGSYMAELASRFDGGFDPGKGNNLTVEEMTPPKGYLLVARLDGKAIGCGALKKLGPSEGEVKRVWTSPEARGLGVASRLMDALESLAREVGFATVKLDTNRTLVEAQAMYRKRGYAEITRYNDNPYAHHWFEKTL